MNYYLQPVCSAVHSYFHQLAVVDLVVVAVQPFLLHLLVGLRQPFLLRLLVGLRQLVGLIATVVQELQTDLKVQTV